MKKIKYYLLLFIFSFLPYLVKASEYEVKDYEVTIGVTKEREYSYSENININFQNNNIVLEKYLPISAEEIEINADYLMETDDKRLIKITNNSENETYTYKYLIKEEKYDNDIYEININNTFNESLKNIKYYIEIAEDFNKNNLEFYLNEKKIEDIEYKINNNTIEGTLKELKVHDKLTIKIDYTKIYLSSTTAIATIVPIVLTIISALLWYVFGKDLKYKPSKSYSLDEDMDPLDVGLLINGNASEKDALALLLYLANEGYISITENSTNNYTIKMEKEYDGKKYSINLFLKSLFKKDTSITLTDYINIISERRKVNNGVELEKVIENKKLTRRFQRAKNMTLPVVNDIEEKCKYFEKKSEKNKAYLIIILATILMLLTSVPFIEINKLYLLPISVVFSIITLYLLMSFVENSDFKIDKKNLIRLIIVSIIVLIIMLLPAFRRNRIYLITLLICSICIITILFFYKFMPKRTIYGTKKYAKVEGLKLFIQAKNINDFKILLSKNKNYIYEILPFSYTYDLNDELFTIMNELDVKEPTWFKMKDDFTTQKLSNSIERLNKVLTKNSEE